MSIIENKYKVLSFSALFFLLLLQFKFLISTYENRNSQYFLEEKELLSQKYREGIVNDYVYPGGKKIIDSILLKEIGTLSFLHASNSQKFKTFGDSLYQEIVSNLRSSPAKDIFFANLLLGDRVTNPLLYSTILQEISVTFDGSNYIPLHFSDNKSEEGALICGDLTALNITNEIAVITVSAPIPNTYRISYAYHVDHASRSAKIVVGMLPAVFFSLVSMALVILIYILLYQNWHKQKKLTLMKTDFLNSVTHEFNTPLASIIVASQSLKNLARTDEKYLVIQAVIQRQAIRLQRLINQTISITKLEKETVEKTYFDVQDLIRQIVHDYLLNKPENVIVEFDDQVGASAKPVLLNEFLFTTLVLNLLENAVKFNTNVSKRINMTLSCHHNELLISIFDNGIGISDQSKNKIFEQYYREPGALKKEGLGLGLFYVKKIIEFHKWRIFVKSKEGYGSEFIIILSRS